MQKSTDKKTNKIQDYVKEIIAIIFWIYLIIKLAVFDLDIYLIDKYFPLQRFVLDYKLFILLAFISILWLIIGKKFPSIFAYIIGYPLLLIFWKIPKSVFRNWETAIILTPVFFGIITTFRLYFISYTLAIIAAACILTVQPTSNLTTQSINILLSSMVTLFVLLAIHLWGRVKQAYNSTVFLKICNIITTFKDKIKDTVFLEKLFENNKVIGEEEKDNTSNGSLYNFYMLHFGIEFIKNKIRNVLQSKRMDLYLLFSWVSIFLITCLIFSFEYLALFKINPKSFSIPFEPTYFSFLGFSFGKLTPASASKIVPEDLYADVICYAEIASSVIIYFILIFTILTVARQRYNEDIETLIQELSEIILILEQATQKIFNLAFSEIEAVLINDNHKSVNWTRRLKGIPELSAFSDDSKKQSDSGESS